MTLHYFSINNNDFFRIKLKSEENKTIYFLNNFGFYSSALIGRSGHAGLAIEIISTEKKIDLRKIERIPKGYFLVDFDCFSRYRDPKIKIRKNMSGINKLKRQNRFLLEHSNVDSIAAHDSIFIDLIMDKPMFNKENYYDQNTGKVIAVDSLKCTAHSYFFYSYEKTKKRKTSNDFVNPTCFKGYTRTEITSNATNFPIH